MATPVGDLGTGAAFVIDYAPSILARLDNIGQQLQLQAQQRQQKMQSENAQILEQLAKVNPNGIRRADQQEFIDMYNEIRNEAIGVQDITDPRQRSIARANIQNRFNDLSVFANASKQVQEGLTTFGNELSKNRTLYNDEVISKYNTLFNKPSSQISQQELNPLTYERRVDDSKAFDSLVKGVSDMVGRAEIQTRVGERIRTGNINSTQVDEIRSINTQAASDYILQRANADPDTEAYLLRKYPGMNIGEAAINEAQQLNQLGYLNKFDRELVRDRAPRESSGRGSQAQQESTYRQQQITGILQGDNRFLDDLRGAIAPGIGGRPSRVDYNPQTRTVTIQTPVQMTTSGQIRYETNEVVNIDSPSAVSQLNRILNTATGQNVSIGSVMTQGGRPRGPVTNLNPNQNSVSSQQTPQFRGVPQGGF